MDVKTDAQCEPPPGWCVNDQGELVMQAEAESDDDKEIVDDLTKELASFLEEPEEEGEAEEEEEEEENELFKADPDSPQNVQNVQPLQTSRMSHPPCTMTLQSSRTSQACVRMRQVLLSRRRLAQCFPVSHWQMLQRRLLTFPKREGGERVPSRVENSHKIGKSRHGRGWL